MSESGRGDRVDIDGWLKPRVPESFAPGRWGTVDDVTNLVSFLVSDAGQWISGQVINSEGGFRRGR